MSDTAKKGILVVSFGTSHEDTRAVTIDAIEKEIGAAFTDCKIYRAWTSKMILAKIEKRDHIHYDNVAEAMERMKKDGITEVMIKSLHAMDDHEVYLNVKNGHPPMTAEQKVAKKEWEVAHPGEKYTMNWNLSLDYIAGEDDEEVDKSHVLAGASYDLFDEEEVSPEVQRLRDVVSAMTDRQKQVYQLVLLEERGYTEVAKLLDCSAANVKQICNKVIALIKAGV